MLVLLALNWAAVLMTASSGQPRVKVPFSPYFLDQVQAGKVQSISSKSDTISGTFKSKMTYPAGSKATPTTLFSTQVPSFWNNASLTQMLRSEGVQVNAQNPNPGTSTWRRSCSGSGPRYC